MHLSLPFAVLAFVACSDSFAAARLPINEVPKGIVENFGNHCSAAALAAGVQAVEVNGREVRTVFAIPCQEEGRGVTGNLVYVLTPKGGFRYLSFRRLRGSSNYVPTPELEINGQEVTIRFRAPTSACREAESAAYRLADNFAAESILHTCEN